MKVSIIIPLYNEENSIGELLGRLLKLSYPAFVSSTEIILVDDRSSDRSVDVVQNFIKDHSNIKLLAHSINQGKGAAVQTGIKSSSGEVILIQDGDLELSPLDIPALLTAMHELQVPFVNGSRYLPGILRTQPAFKRYFANKIFTQLTSIFINVHLTDMACGYKLFTRELYDKLNLKEKKFGFEAELLIKCARLRKNWIAEVPVRYSPRNEGQGKKLRNMDGLRVFNTIIKYGLFKMK